MSALLTQHAIDRCEQRMGLRFDSLQRMADKALEEGITHAQARGRLKRFCDGLYLEHCSANNIRIFGEFIFVFNRNVLITILHVPNKLKHLVVRQRSKPCP
jgi:hypothetical protein